MMRKLLLAALGACAISFAAYAQQEESAAPPPDDGGVVVRGAIDRPVPAPPGDPRTQAQRMRDIRAWDRCVTQAQSAGDTDPMRYQAESPEELCSRSLGMAERTAVPAAAN